MIANLSTIVAVVAALIAALAALYARWQARAAQRSNEISLHSNRLNIYRALLRFRALLAAHGARIKDDEVWRFAEASDLSEFYYPKDIYLKLNGIFDRALKLLSINDQWEEAREHDSEKANALNKERNALMQQTRDDCYKYAEDLKRHLRVGVA